MREPLRILTSQSDRCFEATLDGALPARRVSNVAYLAITDLLFLTQIDAFREDVIQYEFAGAANRA